MLMRSEQQVERAVADEQREIRQGSKVITCQGFEFGLYAAFSQKYSRQLNACKGSRIAEDLSRALQRVTMGEENAFDFPQRGNGYAIQDFVTIRKQHLHHADQAGIQLIALQHFCQL